VAALQRSRPVHGPCGEGEKGASEPQCRARPWNAGEKLRASVAFDREKKGKGEGFGAGDATRRKEERDAGRGHATWRRTAWARGAWQPTACGRQHLRPAGSDGCGSGSQRVEAGEQGGVWGLRVSAWAGRGKERARSGMREQCRL
jgi:hypothetical protein